MVENELLMQFQADILDRPVVRPAVQETTALGAAYAAGLAVGFYRDIEELCARLVGGPDAGTRAWTSRGATELYAFWKKAVTRSFDWL